MRAIQLCSTISNFIFSVANDFQMDKSLTGRCSSDQQLDAKQSFAVDINDDGGKLTCTGLLGHLFIAQPGNLPLWGTIYLLPSMSHKFILRPEITTTDESLRTVSPKMYGKFLNFFRIYKVL